MSLIKKKRVSKKRKDAWRKHVDIRDVENFLDEQRFEERVGKPADKTDEELFTLDLGTTEKLSSKQKRRLHLKKTLPKCFSMLQPHSQVPDPIIKRNRVKTKDERKNLLVKKREEERMRKGILKAKERQSVNDKKKYQLKRSKVKSRVQFDQDLWNLENGENEPWLQSEWIDNNTKRNVLRGMGRLTKIVPKSVRSKKSCLPSVSPPHPGTSYNPSLEDHLALLNEVANKEAKIMKEENHLERVTKNMFTKVPRAENENNWIVEMSEGLEPTKDECEEGHYKAVNPPVKNKKKLPKQRRKQKELQMLKYTKQLAKKEKKKVADIYKLRLLKDEIDKKEKKAEKLRLKRLQRKKLKELEPKRLNSIQFEEQEIEFNAPQDISGNLRNVTREGSLLMDRFKSLQKRNILQPTTVQSHKRAKVKRFQRPGHKNDWKVTVARPNMNNKMR